VLYLKFYKAQIDSSQAGTTQLTIVVMVSSYSNSNNNNNNSGNLNRLTFINRSAEF